MVKNKQDLLKQIPRYLNKELLELFEDSVKDLPNLSKEVIRSSDIAFLCGEGDGDNNYNRLDHLITILSNAENIAILQNDNPQAIKKTFRNFIYLTKILQLDTKYQYDSRIINIMSDEDKIDGISSGYLNKFCIIDLHFTYLENLTKDKPLIAHHLLRKLGDYWVIFEEEFKELEMLKKDKGVKRKK